MTVRAALGELEHAGLIVSRRPLGFLVRDRAPMLYRPQAEFEPAGTAVGFLADFSRRRAGPRPALAAPSAQPRNLCERLGLPARPVIVAWRLLMRTLLAGCALRTMRPWP